jgi:4-oxalocrotonate tautomerase
MSNPNGYAIAGYCKEISMPYVNIKVTREGTAPGASATTPEQKKALIAGVTDLLFKVMGKAPATTFVVIEEVDLENWGVGGLTVPEYRARR